jgi:hypothetical protein
MDEALPKMFSYNLLRMAVYGTLGPNSTIDRSTQPHRVQKLHLMLDILPGDDFFKGGECYLATEPLAASLAKSDWTGLQIKVPAVDPSGAFQSFYPGKAVPQILWLDVVGVALKDDFGLDATGQLIVSGNALCALQQFNLKDCRIYDGNNPPSSEQSMNDAWAEARKVVEQLKKARQM